MKIHCRVPSPVISPDLLEIRIKHIKDLRTLGVFSKKDLDQKSNPEQLPEIVKVFLISSIVEQVVVIPGWAFCVTLSQHVKDLKFEDIKKLVSSVGHSFSPNSDVKMCGLERSQSGLVNFNPEVRHLKAV